MKNKLLSVLCSVCLVMSFIPFAYANESNKDVEPNVYEKRDIQINQHGRNNLMERKELPEEQMELTFDKDQATESEQLTDELFQSGIIETNTITSKADKMELFSVADQELRRELEKEIPAEESNLLMILMIVAVIVIIGMIFWITPRLQQTQD